MNNKIIAVILAVVVIGGGAYFLSQNKNENNVAGENQSANSATETSVETGTIKSLVAAGKTQQCTFSSKEDATQSSGTMFFANGKMRGDFNTTTENVKVASHMIYDGSTSHFWTDGSTTGFKMTLDENAKADANTQSQGLDPNKNFEFDCKSWSADNSKFDLPSGVQFTDLSAMTGAAASGASGAAAAVGAGASTGSAASTKAMQQQICNSLSGTEKAQCLAALQ